MNNLFRLLKVSYINNFGLNTILNRKIAKEDKGKSIKSFGMLVIMALSVIGIATVYAGLIGEGLAKINAIQLLPMLAALITVLVTFMMSIFKSTGIIFSFKDYDLLMSLPIKNSTILSGKLIELLSLNIGISAMIMIPSTIVYFNKSDASMICFLYMLIGIVALPLIPIIVASLIGFIISYLSSRVRYSKAISTIGLMVVFIVIYLGSSKMQDILTFVVSKADSLRGTFERVYPPSAWLSIALIDGDIISLIKFLAVSIIPFILFVIIFSKSFKTINSKLGESYQKADYKLTTLKKNGVFQSLLKKEFKRYFASTTYVFNTLSILILLIIMSIVTVSTGEDFLGAIPMVDGRVIVLASAAMFSLIVGMGCTTPSSISIEGNNFWIMKSLPVRAKEIFKAKIALYLILSVPCIIISTIIMKFGLGFSTLDMLFIIIISSLFDLFISIVGLYANLLYPKFDWKQEIKAVKNTISVTITIFASAISVALGFGAYILFKPANISIFMLGILLAELLLIWAAWHVLNTKGSNLYKRL